MATGVGTAGLTRLYGEMTSLDRILRALTADGVDVEHLQARDLYERDLDCQNLGAVKMVEVIAAAVAEYRIPEPTDTVLDVGCGLGGPGRFLADRFGCSVLGVDVLPLRIEVAEALTDRTGLADRITYQVADATHLPVDDRALAQVWMLDVGIHVRDKKALFAEVARALQPGGIFVMHDQTGAASSRHASRDPDGAVHRALVAPAAPLCRRGRPEDPPLARQLSAGRGTPTSDEGARRTAGSARPRRRAPSKIRAVRGHC
jgi:SAM-dependent methyltransferase